MKRKRKNKSLRNVSIFKLNNSFDLISDCVIPHTDFSPNQVVQAINYKNRIVIKPYKKSEEIVKEATLYKNMET